jgi:hypothetical protein
MTTWASEFVNFSQAFDVIFNLNSNMVDALSTPTTTIHQGAILGIEIANKIAVKIAEPSAIAGLIGEFVNFSQAFDVIFNLNSNMVDALSGATRLDDVKIQFGIWR